MNEKYSLKIIQHGKTEQVRTVQNGAGMAGQAVVIQATDAARFQLVNVVTLVSPTKLQLKRVGDALHLVLPGGDIDAPDLVIQDYFKVTGASLQGSSISGEWVNYDTAGLATNIAPSVAGTDTLLTSVVDRTSNVSLGGEGVLGAFTDHLWLWAGGIAVAAAAGGGGGGASTTPTGDTSPLGVVQAYANGGSTTAPTTAQYTAIGLTLPTIAGLTAANVLSAMNAVVASKNSTDVATLAQLQTLVDNMSGAYRKILAEANGGTVDATPGVDPTLADYASVGIVMGATTQTLALMNSALGEKTVTGVDSVDKLKAMATASDDVMKVAAGTSGAAITYTDLLVLGLKINGSNSAITAVQAAELQANLANLESSLGLAESFTTGAAVNTFAKVQALLSLQVMRSFNDDTAAIGSKSQTAPGVSDYVNVGIKSYASLSSTANSSRVDLTDANFSAVAGFSLQTTLNSALDKLSAGTSLKKAGIQSMVDSYYRILKEADGSTSINTDVYADAANDPSGAGNDPLAVDYANVGVTKVDGTALTVVSTTNTEILALLNDAVGRFSTTSVDTVAELSALEKAAENIMAIGAGTGTGLATAGVTYTTDAEWIAGFTALGVTGVTTANLAAVKKAIDAADVGTTLIPAGTPIDTVQELLDLVKPVIALQVLVDYTNTNGGGTVPTLSTYTDAGIKAYASLNDTLGADRVALSASNADINALNSALDKLTGSSLTLNSSNTLFDGTVQKMVDSYYRILKEADGKYIGDANGGAAYYDDSTVAKTANTDVYADAANDPSGAGNDPLAIDYANVGVTKVDGTALTVVSTTNTEILALLNDAVGRFSATSVDTVAELSALEKAAENIIAVAAGTGAGLATVGVTYTTDAEWIAGFTTLGVIGVNTSNITAVKAAIDTKDSLNNGTTVDTVAELQAEVSLVRMKAFTNDAAAIGSKAVNTPTLADWGALVNTNTNLLDPTLINLDAAAYWKTSNPFNGVNALNSALDTYVGDSTLTSAKLKTIADAYGRVLQEADNSRTTNTDVSKVDNSANADLVVADLTNLGVTFLNTPGTATTLLSEQNLVLGAISGLASTSVDTVTELNDLAKAANNVVKQAAGGTGGNLVTYLDSEWVSALSSLSISGANTSNIAAIKTAIIATAHDGTGVDSYNELQSLVGLVRVNDYAALNTGYTLPTIEDYQAIVAQYGTAADKTTYNLTGSTGINAGGTDLAYSNASSAYLSSYNDAVNYKPSNAFTGLEVKNMVLAYNSILAEANGATTDQTTYDPLGSDYTAVGVTAVSTVLGTTAMLSVAEYAALLTDVVANKSTSQVDQVSELDALANIIVKIQDLEGKTAVGGTNYTTITGGALQVSELTALGLNTTNLTDGTYSGTVLANRLNNVYDNIIAIDHTSAVSRATLDSLAEMQALINNTSGIVI